MLAWWQQHRVSGGEEGGQLGGGTPWHDYYHKCKLEMLECCSYLLGMLTSVKLWRLVR